MQIDNLAIGKGWRRLGIASRLLRQGLQESYELGALHAFLEVRSANSAARALYEHYAFAIIGRRPAYYQNPSDDALLMQSDIVNSLAMFSQKTFENNDDP
jgi:ribosomal-protein-alanine N-acetyltransferase